ncbi:glycosyltransferase [Vagococcus fluvialis]|uniref:glycosyltransferase n=1 Tax=Vagococcus fluvialis TaxID=2738 RepID=UPI003B218EDE
MRKVAVLLSTYNGERYVEEQISSVMSQKNVMVDLFIRDDKSTDSTVEILKEKFGSNEHIKILIGTENLGYKQGFKYLIDYVNEYEKRYDYFSFCDQDDFWEEEKLTRAIQKIEAYSEHKTTPISYSSNLKIVDKELNFINYMYSYSPLPTNLEQFLLNGYAYGCTIILNKDAYNIIKRFDGKKKFAFDFYIPIIVSCYGHNIYDEESYILYRQHESNVIGANRNFKKQLNGALYKYGINYYSDFSRELLLEYEDIVQAKKNILEKYSKVNLNFKNKFALFLDSNVHKNTFKGTLLLKYMILKGGF